MAKRPTPPDPDKPIVRKHEEEHTETIPVGYDRDDAAKAETQNRQSGIDDTKENRDVLREAGESTAVDTEVVVPPGNVGTVQPAPSTVKPSTQAAMPGDLPATDAGGRHTVTINGQEYTWMDGDEKSVPAEAVEVYNRAKEANEA